MSFNLVDSVIEHVMGLPPLQYRLIIRLAKHCSKDGVCQLRSSFISDRIECDPASFRRARGELVKAGLIRVDRVSNEVSRYTVFNPCDGLGCSGVRHVLPVDNSPSGVPLRHTATEYAA